MSAGSAVALVDHELLVGDPQESNVRVDAMPLPDLLMDFLIYEAADSEDAAKRRIDHEISQLRESGC